MWYSAVGCVVMLTLSLLVAPLAATAQPAGKVPEIGIRSLVLTSTARNFEAFTQGLRALGYIEGQHIVIEQRYADGRLERLPALASELVQRHVDVLVAGGSEVILRAARQATSTIPIVMVAVDYDPIALGYIAGLPRPGGQITGLFLQQIEVTGKCLNSLRMPSPRSPAWPCSGTRYLRTSSAPRKGRHGGQRVAAPIARAAQTAGYDYASAFEAAAREGAEALLVLRSPLFVRDYDLDRIIALAAQHRLPTMSGCMGLPAAGALMAYGADNADMYRRAGHLRGPRF